MKNILVLGLMGSFVFWPLSGSAELYKWTDDQGTLHITDTLPSGMQKKSVTAPAPRSTLPKKTTVQPILPGQPLAEVEPISNQIGTPPVTEAVPMQRASEGLSPSQATLTSAWQTFNGSPMNTKAPVRRWKDEQGLDHLSDVLPTPTVSAKNRGKLEDLSVSRATRKAKERVTGVSRLRHPATE